MTPNPFRRLSFRLLLWHSGAMLLLLAFLGTILYVKLDETLRADLDAQLRETAQSALALVELEHGALIFEETEPGRITPDRLPGVENRRDLVRLIAADGKVVSTPEPLRALPLPPVPSPGGKVSSQMETAVLAGEPVRVHTVPVMKGGKRLGTLQVVTSLRAIRRTLGYLVRLLVLIGAAALIPVVWLGQFLARRALDPVENLTWAARTIGANSLSMRLNLPNTGDELSYLASSFDGMLERIESSYRRQREFAANASHELRTPLALIKGEASLGAQPGTDPAAMRSALKTIDEEADRMTALVHDLLFLARLDRGELLRAVPVGLDEVAHDVVGRFARPAKERGVSLVVEAPEAVVVRGDEAALERVFRNLVQNALEHTTAGEIRVAVFIRHGLGVAQVSDTGCGIPLAHQERVFDRFHQVDDSRTGGSVGLGLALCREIVYAHRGTLYLHSQEGRGTTVTFEIPLLD